MTAPLTAEVRTTHERQLDTRRRIEAGKLGGDALAASIHMPPKQPRR